VFANFRKWLIWEVVALQWEMHDLADMKAKIQLVLCNLGNDIHDVCCISWEDPMAWARNIQESTWIKIEEFEYMKMHDVVRFSLGKGYQFQDSELYLSDNCLDFALQILTNDEPGKSFYRSDEGTYIVSPCTANSFRRNDNPTEQLEAMKAWVENFRERAEEECTTLVLILNFTNNHWFTVTLNREGNSYTINDSKETSLETRCLVQRYVFSMLEALNWGLLPEFDDFESVRQTNGYDCGIYAIMNAFGVELPKDGHAAMATNLRKWLMWQCINLQWEKQAENEEKKRKHAAAVAFERAALAGASPAKVSAPRAKESSPSVGSLADFMVVRHGKRNRQTSPVATPEAETPSSSRPSLSFADAARGRASGGRR
jgi:hypothetical protein